MRDTDTDLEAGNENLTAETPELKEAGMPEEDPETRRLREENERLREEIERVRSLPMKERLYDRIHVSLRTLDIFIGIMIALGVIVVIIGMTR